METVQRTQLMARRRQFVQKDTTTARWSKTADILVSHGSFETAFMNATKNTWSGVRTEKSIVACAVLRMAVMSVVVVRLCFEWNDCFSSSAYLLRSELLLRINNCALSIAPVKLWNFLTGIRPYNEYVISRISLALYKYCKTLRVMWRKGIYWIILEFKICNGK